jgi:hypothetical protein
MRRQRHATEPAEGEPQAQRQRTADGEAPAGEAASHALRRLLAVLLLMRVCGRRCLTYEVRWRPPTTSLFPTAEGERALPEGAGQQAADNGGGGEGEDQDADEGAGEGEGEGEGQEDDVDGDPDDPAFGAPPARRREAPCRVAAACGATRRWRVQRARRGLSPPSPARRLRFSTLHIPRTRPSDPVDEQPLGTEESTEGSTEDPTEESTEASTEEPSGECEEGGEGEEEERGVGEGGVEYYDDDDDDPFGSMGHAPRPSGVVPAREPGDQEVRREAVARRASGAAGWIDLGTQG